MNVDLFCSKYGIDRHNSNSLKWDALKQRFGDSDLISMWVADMEFKVPEAVTQAMIKRVEHGAFGYSYLDDSYFQAISNWQKTRHGLEIKKEWVRFSTGVVGALYWFVNAFTKPEDSVIIITPVYYPFHNAVKDTGRKLVKCELDNKNGIYSLNYSKFEKMIIDNKVKLYIQSSPHNPVSKVWTLEEHQQILSICKKHNVLVISDEIHQDIIMPGYKQIPALLVDNGKYADNIIMVTSASKSFNLAGLIHSHIIIPDEKIREKYDAYAKTISPAETNIIGAIATQSAYEKGGEWFDSMLNVIYQNYQIIKTKLEDKLPKATITPLEGTYLVWIDLRAYLGTEGIKEFIQDKCRLAVDYGEWFSDDAKGFIRINLATLPKFVNMAADNIIKNIK